LDPDMTADGSRRKTPEISSQELSGRRMHPPPPERTSRHQGAREAGEGRKTVDKPERPSPQQAEERAAPSHSPSPPRPAERAQQTSPPHLRAAPPCHHGRPGGAQRCRTLPTRKTEGGGDIGLFQAASVGGAMACFTVKLGHGSVNPKSGSGRTNPGSSTAGGK
jgi:hypothetical protein